MHRPYSKKKGHRADFRIEYRFRSAEDGGRLTGPPFQAIRCDFSIDNEPRNCLYMIWPEFEDENRDVIMSLDKKVPVSGTARMWIVNDSMRPIHYEKIHVGMVCYFVEGNRITADCEVVEILDLLINPIK